MAKAPVLTPRAIDFPRWYQDLVGKAEFADNGPVRRRPGRPGDGTVTVRCLVAADGSVPGAGDAPGNVAIVARAY